MQASGSDIFLLVLSFLLVACALWAVLALQRRRRRDLLDRAEDGPAQGADASLGPKAARSPLPQDLEGPQPELQPPSAPAREAASLKKPSRQGPDLLLSAGMASTRASLWGRMSEIIGGAPQLDGAAIEALEEVLLLHDVGVEMTMQLIDALQSEAKKSPLTADEVRALLKRQLLDVFAPIPPAADLLGQDAAEAKPRVVLFVGVNGVGKTTTIGKVAHALTQEGKQVVLAAGDTFRAAAAEQLQIWGERTGARVVRGAERADPASVMFNAMQAAQAQGADVLLADTAGRLHTNVDLMDEIKKVRRALGRLRSDAPDEVWLVVDATTGQNALHQAKQFHEAVTLTGLILTKLDGTAKGGIVVAIAHALKIPVCYIGVGEQAEALRPFAADAFVEALL